MSEKKAIITIDGPSGAGKSSISSLVAERLNFTCLDTGAMYRAAGLKIHRCEIDEKDEKALAELLDNLDLSLAPDGVETLVFLDGEDVSSAVRAPETAMIASRVSAIPAVRKKLTSMQRRLGRAGNIVAEGRDMGTVVFPEADYKFYLDASPDERADRRVKQLLEKGAEQVNRDEILQQIIKRDQNDSARELSPLKPAQDATIIDSTKMTKDNVVKFILDRVNVV